MKLFLCLFTAIMLSVGIAFPIHSQAAPQVIEIRCHDTSHTYSQRGLVRPYGDSNGWAFTIELKDGASWVKDHEPEWTHSGDSSGDNVADPTWGQWQGGKKNDTTISWSQPETTGAFFVTVKGQITCGGGGGGGPINIEVDWFGNVKNKHWDTGTAIGKKPQPDGTTTEDGRIISPQDWRVNPPNPPIVTVDPGETVNLQVEDATDIDHWTIGNEECTDQKCYDPDDVNYTWNAGGNGVLTPTDGKGQTITWKAPDTGGTYPIHCTIDDTPKPIDTDNDEDGTRDDAKLIRQMQIKVANWEISFYGSPYACAGHVPDGVHSFTMSAYLKRDGQYMPNHAITLYFDPNKGDKLKAAFDYPSENENDDPTEQIHLTTDANGEVFFSVLSSDLVTNDIIIKAKTMTPGGHEIELDGQEICHFEEAESERNFPLDPNVNSFAGDADHGWWFDPDVLISGGDETTAKLYLKYEDHDGILEPVNGHTMKITIGKIIDKDGNEINESDYGHYIYFVDAEGNQLLGENNQPQNFAEAVTTTYSIDEEDEDIQHWFEGFATVYLKGGDFIYQAKTITLKAEDQTQVK